MTIPRNILSLLAIACGATFALYVVLMLSAIYFASSATEIASTARSVEADVVALETEYYAAITELSKTDPSSLGYVTPSRVEYVAAVGAPTVTRAE